MRFNVNFTTYRRATSSGDRIYSATATITAGRGFFKTTDGSLKASLGVDFSVEMYTLITEQTDFARYDKVTINSADYYIESFETVDTGAQLLTKILLTKQHGN